jgi:hypothetical protein
MKVRINIDSLVLDGISKQDAAGFARGLEQELSRLVRENGIGGVSDIGMLDAGAVRLARDAKPDSAATNVARSIYRSLSKNEHSHPRGY